jgi:hypothetical protein
VPKTVDALKDHALIGFDRETPFLRAAKSGLALLNRNHFTQRCDSDVAQLALIRAGAGIGVCQVAMHDDLRSSPRCRAPFDALVQGLRRYLR